MFLQDFDVKKYLLKSDNYNLLDENVKIENIKLNYHLKIFLAKHVSN